MHLDLLAGPIPLISLVLGVILLFGFLLYPLRRRYPDDMGDGMTLVLLPPPRLPAYWRAPAFLALFVVLTLVYHSLKGTSSPDYIYGQLVIHLSEKVVRAPAEINGALGNFTMGLRFLVFGTMVSLGILGRGSVARRGMIIAQAFLYLLVMVFVDALLMVIGVVFGWPIGPASFLGNFAAILVGFLGMARILFANFAMPRPTALPYVPRPRLNDALTLIGVTLAAVAICMIGVLFIYHLANIRYRPVLALILPVPFAEGSLIVRTGLLALVNLATVRPDPPVGDHPPIDIIIPAYNEEEVIADTLLAIDAAAGRYEGPVNVILVNDGSIDRTRAIAEHVMGRFVYARGQVYDGHHGGKSEALNAALERTTADIVIRIDADTVIGEWSLYYTPRWFDDPQIGLVEAMMFPRWRPALYPHMRLFEELKQFGFTHWTVQSVDGVNVVPGVFTAFRRNVAMAIGGFTVGMNGEDGDFTLRFGRMGYRSWMDPKIVIYEDVPGTYGEIREQRVRWSRAIFHNQSRNGPYRAGLASPKVWFSQTHQFYKINFAPATLMLPIYLLMVALFEGAYRNVILVFLGAWVLGKIVFMGLETVLAAGYRQLHQLAWVLAWPVWELCLEMFATEAWLSMPARPAGIHGTRPTAVAGYVIH